MSYSAYRVYIVGNPHPMDAAFNEASANRDAKARSTEHQRATIEVRGVDAPEPYAAGPEVVLATYRGGVMVPA